MIFFAEPYVPMSLQNLVNINGTFDVVTDQGETLTASIIEVSSGNTETQLNVLLDILSEIEESLQDTEKNVSNKIISSIKKICLIDTLFKKN